jgi:CRISPR/Cas system-associated exonuclease Cas4 (RecB family)
MKTARVEDIVKTPEDVEKIKSTVLSATTLQNYLACPAKFYYGTVKELKAEEEVAESLDYGMFGTVYHETMRSLYTSEEAMSVDFFFDYKGENEKALTGSLKSVTKEYIQSWLSRENEIRAKIKSLIIRELNLMEVSGRNLVVTDVILKYVMKTLQRDLELLQTEGAGSFEVLGREVRVHGEFKGQRFKGFIDRLDSFHEGQVRVVDYKTGKVLEDDEKINDDNAEAIADNIFASDVKDRPKIALQFYMYDLLLENHPLAKGKQMYNCVYSPAKLFKEAPLTMPRNQRFFNAVSERLEQTLNEMYSLEIPFRRTSDEKICEYCDFKMICGR